MLSTFLNAIGENKPQLVGFNSQRSDLKILVQRAVAQGIQAKEFAKRPNKPWEGVDYFDSKFSPVHVYLIEILGGHGKSTPSLHEMANVCGIPGKIGVWERKLLHYGLKDASRKSWHTTNVMHCLPTSSGFVQLILVVFLLTKHMRRNSCE